VAKLKLRGEFFGERAKKFFLNEADWAKEDIVYPSAFLGREDALRRIRQLGAYELPETGTPLIEPMVIMLYLRSVGIMERRGRLYFGVDQKAIERRTGDEMWKIARAFEYDISRSELQHIISHPVKGAVPLWYFVLRGMMDNTGEFIKKHAGKVKGRMR